MGQEAVVQAIMQYDRLVCPTCVEISILGLRVEISDRQRLLRRRFSLRTVPKYQSGLSIPSRKIVANYLHLRASAALVLTISRHDSSPSHSVTARRNRSFNPRTPLAANLCTRTKTPGHTSRFRRIHQDAQQELLPALASSQKAITTVLRE